MMINGLLKACRICLFIHQTKDYQKTQTNKLSRAAPKSQILRHTQNRAVRPVFTPQSQNLRKRTLSRAQSCIN